MGRRGVRRRGRVRSARRGRQGLSGLSWLVVVILLCGVAVPHALVVGYLRGDGLGYAWGQVLVSFSVILLPLLFLRARGWLVWHGLLLGVLLPIELAGWLWQGEPLSYAVYSGIRGSDLSEAWGQIRGHLGLLGLVVLCVAAYFTLLFLFVPRGAKRSFPRWRVLLPLIVVLTLGAPFLVTRSPDAGAGWRHFWERQYFPTLKGMVNGAFPLDILRHTIAYEKARALEESEVGGRDLGAISGLSRADEGATVGVLVIGETSRGCNWQLGGYYRPTNPLLSRREGLVYYGDAYAGSNYTLLSVPMLVSGATPESSDSWRASPLLPELLSRAGIRTGWVTSQSTRTAWGRVAMAGSDHVRVLDFSFPHTTPYDAKLLPYVREFLDSVQGSAFLVVHTYGGHFHYRDRYPREYAYFRPELGESVAEVIRVGPEDREGLVNSFDNTIVYTDMVLDSIAQYLTRRGGNSFLLYTADHGENLYDGPGIGHLHASASPTHYESHVPYFVWLSEGYRRSYAVRDSLLRAHRDMPVDHSSTFHTVLDLMGVRYPGKDASRSLADSGYVSRRREVLNASGERFPAPGYPEPGDSVRARGCFLVAPVAGE